MIILYLLGALIAAMLLICIFLILKNENTWKMQKMILDAIHKYNSYMIWNGELNEDKLIEFDCMEDYNKTLLRLYDWGFKRIVSKDVYEKIKSYL